MSPVPSQTGAVVLAHNTVRQILNRPYLVIHAEPTSITQPHIFQWATADETGYGQAWLANPGPETWSPERRALWQHKLKHLSRMPPVQRFRERTFNELRRRETLVAWNAELTRRALPKMVCLVNCRQEANQMASIPPTTEVAGVLEGQL